MRKEIRYPAAIKSHHMSNCLPETRGTRGFTDRDLKSLIPRVAGPNQNILQVYRISVSFPNLTNINLILLKLNNKTNILNPFLHFFHQHVDLSTYFIKAFLLTLINSNSCFLSFKKCRTYVTDITCQ